MPIQRGIAREIRYKKAASYGTLPGASGAQVIRRVQGAFDLQKPPFGSQEQRSSQQRGFMRTGQRSIVGQVSGELSPGTYKDWMKSALRQGAADLTFATTGAITTVTATIGAPHFVRASGSYITDGFKVGDIVYWTGWTTGGVTNNSKFYRITALTATQMTVALINDATAGVAAKASGDSVTCRVAGRKMMTPSTFNTQSRDYYFCEMWNAEINQSEMADSVSINSMQISMPPNGITQIGFGFVGRDLITAGAQYFTSPTGQTSTDLITSLTGSARFIGGGFTSDMLTITSLTTTLNNDISAPNVAFNQTRPDNFPGILTVSGQGTILFENANIRDAFVNETDLGLIIVVQDGPGTFDDAIVLKIDKCRIATRSINDNPKEITESFTFEVLENPTGGAGTAYDNATLVIQDTSLA